MEKSFEKNPFVEEMGNLKLITKETVHIQSEKRSPTERLIVKEEKNYRTSDVTNFARLFLIGNLDKIIADCRPMAAKLFLYILSKMEKNSDVVDLPFHEIAEAFDVSKSTVHLAVKDLQEAAVIRRKGKTMFWLNPHIMFYGNRRLYYKKRYPGQIENIKDRKPEIFYDGNTKPEEGVTYLYIDMITEKN
jgi:predicted transcriptional regulator